MKKIFRNNNIIAIVFLTFLAVAIAPIASASEIKPTVPAQLIFVGNVKDQPLFKLTVTGNETQNDFIVNVTDEAGLTLYKENFKRESFTKKFLLNTEELGENKIRVEVFCKNTKQSVTYQLNLTSRFVQDLAITKL